MPLTVEKISGTWSTRRSRKISRQEIIFLVVLVFVFLLQFVVLVGDVGSDGGVNVVWICER